VVGADDPGAGGQGLVVQVHVQHDPGAGGVDVYSGAVPVTVRAGVDNRPAAGVRVEKALNETNALSGYLTTARGKTVAFSILVNGHRPGSMAEVLAMERICEAIAAAE